MTLSLVELGSKGRTSKVNSICFTLRMTILGGILVGMTGIFNPLNTLASPGFEAYAVRSSILTTKSQPHPESNLPKIWKKAKRAQIEFVAEILELYPTHEIYFMARDAEYLYDTAILLAQNEAETLRRIHLLNVTRLTAKDPHLLDYLVSQGISRSSPGVRNGFLFVDTGYAGSVLTILMDALAGEIPIEKIQAHFAISAIPWVPSSRAFLTALKSSAVERDPGQFIGSIHTYENLPHRTRRAQHYEPVHPRGWEAMSPNQQTSFSLMSRSLQEDLKAYLISPEIQNLANERRQQWRELKTWISSNETGPRMKRRILLKLHSLVLRDDPHLKAIALDFIETIRKNFSDHAFLLPSLKDLGVESAKEIEKLNRQQTLTQHPEWVPLFLYSTLTTRNLFETKNYKLLKTILDTIADDNLIRALFSSLLERTPEEWEANSNDFQDLILTLIQIPQVDSFVGNFTTQISQRLLSSWLDFPHQGWDQLLDESIQSAPAKLLPQIIPIIKKDLIPTPVRNQTEAWILEKCFDTLRQLNDTDQESIADAIEILALFNANLELKIPAGQYRLIQNTIQSLFKILQEGHSHRGTADSIEEQPPSQRDLPAPLQSAVLNSRFLDLLGTISFEEKGIPELLKVIKILKEQFPKARSDLFQFEQLIQNQAVLRAAHRKEEKQLDEFLSWPFIQTPENLPEDLYEPRSESEPDFPQKKRQRLEALEDSSFFYQSP